MKKIFTYLMAIPVVLTAAIATGCINPEPPAPIPLPDDPKLPTISAIENPDLQTYNSGGVTVTVANADKIKYTHYVKDQRPVEDKIVWTEKAIDKDGKYDIEITGLATDITKPNDYVFEAFACQKDSVSKNTTVNFRVLRAEAVVTEDVRVSSAKISFVGACLPEHCDGFFWKIEKASDFDLEKFIKDCEFNEMWGETDNPLAKGKAVCMLESVQPETDYIIAIQPIIVHEDGDKYEEKIGSVIQIEVTSPEYRLNQKEVTPVEFALKSAAKPLMIELKAGRAEDANIGGCYFGMVSKSELGSLSVSEWIAESGWFYAPISNSGSNFDVINLFNDGDIEVSSGMSAKPETDYVAFVIPFDKDRFVGAVQTLDVKAPKLSFDDPASASVTFTPKRSGAGVSVDFKNGCSRLYYRVEVKDAITLDSAVVKMIEFASAPYPSECWIAGESDQQIYNLTASTVYDVFLLPMSETGNFGTATKIALETASDQIDVDQSITMSITSVSNDPTYEFWSWHYDCVVALGSNAVSYDYGQVGSSLEGLGPNPTAIQIASKLYTEWGFNGQSGTETNVTVDTENPMQTPYPVYIVFIPKDAAGKLGVPVFQKVTVPINPSSAPANRRR